ncbi:MAG: FIST signal transduction protein [Yoonia sp.]|uniref:FIST signal transduction protein n=1 Tax=Yoonia sp. TaxID=2212373 RepID=UPI003EF8E8CD
MMKVGTGWSDEPDSAVAATEALDMAVARLDGQAPQAALVYAAVDQDLQQVTGTLRARFPDLLIAGCTTDGEIAGGEGFLEDSLVIMAFASDTLDFAVGIGQGAIGDPAQATADAVAMARAGSSKDPSLCIAMLEGLGTNIHDLAGGLQKAIGAGVPVVGGAAGDQLRFEGTQQLCNDVVTSDAVVVLTIHGPLSISSGVATGYTPLGQPHTLTKADGAVVHQIDNRPAADLYADYLQQPSIFYPLAVRDESRKSLVLSSPLNFDAETGALHLVNPVAEGSIVQLATASRQEIVDAASNAVGQAAAGFDGKPVDAALLFSCAGRRATLGTRTVEEYDSVRAIVGEDVPTIGFYCYGELGPEVAGGPSLTHTNAFVAVFLSAAEA